MEDNVRELIEKLRKKAIIAGSAAENTINQISRKTGDTVEIAKMNMKIFDLNGEISLGFKKLGELVYSAQKGEQLSDNDIDAIIEDIDMKKSEIEQYRERINILKKSISCPVCQQSCSRDDRFCKKCGTEL